MLRRKSSPKRLIPAALAKIGLDRSKTKPLVHFLHIGKTGGTAIKFALRDAPESGKFRMILHPHRTKLLDIPEGESVAFFLRDPATRFVSAFNSRKRKGAPRFNLKWNPQEEVAFRNFETANDLARALSSQDDDIRDTAWISMGSIPHVAMTYAYWLEAENYLRSRLDDIFFIGFQETLDKDFASFRDKLQLPDRLQLPEGGIDAHRGPQELDVHLDKAALRNIKAWYAADYRIVDLCHETAEEINGRNW